MRRWRRPAPGSGGRITNSVGRGIRLLWLSLTAGVDRSPPLTAGVDRSLLLTAGVDRSLPLSAPVDRSLLLSDPVSRGLPLSYHVSRRRRVLSQQLVDRASRWYISFWEIPWQETHALLPDSAEI